jgi:hypothetical protein
MNEWIELYPGAMKHPFSFLPIFLLLRLLFVPAIQQLNFGCWDQPRNPAKNTMFPKN